MNTQLKNCVQNVEQNLKHGENIEYTAQINALAKYQEEQGEQETKKVYNIQVE